MIPADGKISRMDMPEDLSDESFTETIESYRAHSRMDQGYDINAKLRYRGVFVLWF